MEDYNTRIFMKIAIHHTPGSFSDRWITYCQENRIEYKIVNAYDTDIIKQVCDCDAFMWHHHHADYKDTLFAKQLLYSLQMAGKKVFPNFNTGWHFDDKVGQKYLLEAIGAPIVTSYVFYTKREAIEWVNRTTFPKVFKLRGGAGSSNVKLARTKGAAIKLINKAFGKGFSQFDRVNYFKERFNKWRCGSDTLIGVLNGFAHLFINIEFANMHTPEKGYVYFQDFIPNNKFDIRIIIIGMKAFAIKRIVRKDDFRASGSGEFKYDVEGINIECVKLAFKVNELIHSDCIAYDFIFDANEQPVIVEISYGFSMNVYDPCPGYWTSDLLWHENKFIPQYWMIENLINKILNNGISK